MEIRLGELFRATAKKLGSLYEHPENESVAMLLIEEVFSVSRRDILMNEPKPADKQSTELLEEYINRCLANEPVQHVLGYAVFYGYEFTVSPDVLIPRPETEELVYLVLQTYKNRPLRAMDIGTGSGCIAITIALEHPQARIFACDVSPEALEVAKGNAEKLGASLQFMTVDILKESLPEDELDAILSNPPYIPKREKKAMEQRVTEHEPSLALFVPDDDPLIFYRRIGESGLLHLKSGGGLFMEIHESYGREVVELYIQQGYINVECLYDMQGKQRIVRAFKP